MIDVEAEAAALRDRSAQLVQLLDAATPVVDRSPIRVAQQEATRLARAAHRARAEVAAKVAAGMDPGCPVGRQPPIRRVRTDARGRDLDGVLRSRSVISPELLACHEHARDVVGPAIEQAYRRAVEDRPHSAALVAAARGHLGLLAMRQSPKSEGGAELAAALDRYEAAFYVVRDGIDDGAHTADQARGQLANLEKEAAAATLGLGNETVIEGLIASATATAFPAEVVGVEGSTLPAAKVDAGHVRSARTPRVLTRSAAQRVETRPEPGANLDGFVEVVPAEYMGLQYRPNSGQVLWVN